MRVHEVGQAAVLRAQHVARGHALLVGQEPVGPHPRVVEDLRQVAAAAVRQQDHDHGLRCGDRVLLLEPAREAQRRLDRHAARPADEQPLLAREAARHRERVRVGDRDDLVRDGRVVRGGPEVLAHALDEVGAPVAARVDGARRVGSDDAHAPAVRLRAVRRDLLEVPAGARDRAAGADPGDEVRHAAVGVGPDLGARGLVVRRRAVRVRVLVRLPRARDLADQPVGDRVVGVRVVGGHSGRRHDDARAVRAQHVALVLAHLVGADEDAVVPLALRDEREADARVARRGLHDRAARRSSPDASAASTIFSAMRSLTEPPGFTYSTLARIVALRPSVTRDSRTSGVPPTSSDTCSAYLMPRSSPIRGCARARPGSARTGAGNADGSRREFPYGVER